MNAAPEAPHSSSQEHSQNPSQEDSSELAKNHSQTNLSADAKAAQKLPPLSRNILLCLALVVVLMQLQVIYQSFTGAGLRWALLPSCFTSLGAALILIECAIGNIATGAMRRDLHFLKQVRLGRAAKIGLVCLIAGGFLHAILG
ncbi:hypothetical protein HR45_01695 [Shewanella mangrovi]|uniref:Uncharacterized protein n=1 Tax=Shewanella mangrovi TaxID=1515746 RepID=A0A094JIV6_9GAMM|nr:hypothetical protein [Shewanella mangrovi]KFZ39137.1 hypothetical protein HR45_01695 [Shewanella mangrovi]